MKLLFLSLFTAIFIVFLYLLWLKIAGNNVRKSPGLPLSLSVIFLGSPGSPGIPLSSLPPPPRPLFTLYFWVNVVEEVVRDSRGTCFYSTLGARACALQLSLEKGKTPASLSQLMKDLKEDCWRLPVSFSSLIVGAQAPLATARDRTYRNNPVSRPAIGALETSWKQGQWVIIQEIVLEAG